METFAKIGFAKISLAAQKIWIAQNLGGGEKCKVIIKLFPMTLLSNIFFSTKTVFSAYFIGLLI